MPWKSGGRVVSLKVMTPEQALDKPFFYWEEGPGEDEDPKLRLYSHRTRARLSSRLEAAALFQPTALGSW